MAKNFSRFFDSPKTGSRRSGAKSNISGGPQKRADSYFPREDRVRLVRLVSNWVLPGEKSGEYIIGKPTSSSTYTISQIFRMHILPVYDQLPTTLVILILIMNLVRKVLNDSWAKFDFHKFA